MTLARISISSTGAEEYRALAKRLRQAARKDLRKKLRENISAAGGPVLNEVRSAVRTLPVRGSRGGGAAQRVKFAGAKATARKVRTATARTLRARRRRAGLRASIASATRLQITARGVRFVVNSNRLPIDQRTLPRHLDSEKGWRHPVFGDRENWVHQRGNPYFGATIKRHAPKFRQAILAAMDEISKEIEG